MTYEINRGMVTISITKQELLEFAAGEHDPWFDCVTANDLLKAAKSFGLRLSFEPEVSDEGA